MNSKMRPLWLEFKSVEEEQGSVSIIYKNGDGAWLDREAAVYPVIEIHRNCVKL